MGPHSAQLDLCLLPQLLVLDLRGKKAVCKWHMSWNAPPQAALGGAIWVEVEHPGSMRQTAESQCCLCWPIAVLFVLAMSPGRNKAVSRS